MKKILFFIIIITLFSSLIKAQNQFNLSQYMVHQPFINPGSVGTFESMNGAVFYRTQWTGFDGAPRVSGININSPIGYGKANLGLTLTNDDIGVNNITDLSVNYGYSIKTSLKSKLSFGLSGTLKMSQNNYASVETIGIEDPSFQISNPTLLMPNFKFGTFFNTRKFYVGFAIPNIFHNDVISTGGFSGETNFDFEQIHLFVHSGYKFKINQNLDLNFSTFIKQISGAPLNTDLNLLAEFQKKFGLGLSYRTAREIAALVQFKLNKLFKLAYSYDYTLNNLGSYSNGSHELMLVFDISNPSKPLIIEAPRF